MPSFAARKTVVTKTFSFRGDSEADGRSTLTLEIGSKGTVTATFAGEGFDGGRPVRAKSVAKGDLTVDRHEQNPDRYEAQVSLAFKGVG